MNYPRAQTVVVAEAVKSVVDGDEDGVREGVAVAVADRGVVVAVGKVG